MKIITNNFYRDLISFWDLPKTWQEHFEDSYSYVKDSTFFMYKGNAYDLNDFLTTSQTTLFGGWDGYYNESFFSSIVIKIDEYNERVKVGLALS